MNKMVVTSWRSRGLRFLRWASWAALWSGGLYGYVVGLRVLGDNRHLDSYGERLAVLLYFTLGFAGALAGVVAALRLLFWLAARRKAATQSSPRVKRRGWWTLAGFAPLLLVAALTPVVLPHEKEPSEAASDEILLSSLPQRWNQRKIVVLGLDGLSWKLLRPLLDEGRLPHFEQLCAQGSYGALETLSPTLSPPIWTTLVTGKYPRDHGVVDFTERTFTLLPCPVRALPAGLGLNRLYLFLHRWGLADRALVTRRARRTKALWNIFDDAGMHSVVVGWWASWPAEALRGVVVSDHVNVARMSAYRELGMRAGASQADSFAGDVSPIDRLPELLPLVQDPELLAASDILRFARLEAKEVEAVRAAKRYSRENRYSIIKFELATDQTNYRIGLRLLEDEPWNAFFLYLPGLDGFQHHFYQFRFPSEFDRVDPAERARYEDTINAYYVYLDGLLAPLLQGVDEESYVLVVSDHGIEANPDYSPDEGRGYNQFASGIHTASAPGVFILKGPGVRPNCEVRGAGVIDVAPTLLALLGLPPGRDMPGRVLSELLQAGQEVSSDLERVASHDLGYRPEEDEGAAEADPRLLERLRALGYFD